MRINMTYDGVTYKSTEHEFDKEFIESFYENISDFEKFKLPLYDGTVMIVGKDVIQRAVFIFKE